MRLYGELDAGERSDAVEVAVGRVLLGIIEGAVTLPTDGLRAAFREAAADMLRLETPWFLPTRLMDNDELAAWVRSEALIHAMNTIYLDHDEVAVRLPARAREETS